MLHYLFCIGYLTCSVGERVYCFMKFLRSPLQKKYPFQIIKHAFYLKFVCTFIKYNYQVNLVKCKFISVNIPRGQVS